MGCNERDVKGGRLVCCWLVDALRENVEILDKLVGREVQAVKAFDVGDRRERERRGHEGSPAT